MTEATVFVVKLPPRATQNDGAAMRRSSRERSAAKGPARRRAAARKAARTRKSRAR